MLGDDRTGHGVDGHGITGNDMTGHRLADHPDFVTLATRAGLPTLLAVSGWPPLALAENGGPLFAEAARREFVAVAEESLAGWDAADEAVTGLAASILARDGPRMSFVYLGAVDAVGHALGAGTAYREAARAADHRVGRLLAAVRSRPSSAREGWTVVVVTDHGHLDRGGHGGREPEVATAWAAAAGPGISLGAAAGHPPDADRAPGPGRTGPCHRELTGTHWRPRRRPPRGPPPQVVPAGRMPRGTKEGEGQGTVRTWGPSAVMATVCSAWAARLPSPLRMVQPSPSM